MLGKVVKGASLTLRIFMCWPRVRGLGTVIKAQTLLVFKPGAHFVFYEIYKLQKPKTYDA